MYDLLSLSRTALIRRTFATRTSISLRNLHWRGETAMSSRSTTKRGLAAAPWLNKTLEIMTLRAMVACVSWRGMDFRKIIFRVTETLLRDHDLFSYRTFRVPLCCSMKPPVRMPYIFFTALLNWLWQQHRCNNEERKLTAPIVSEPVDVHCWITNK